MSEEKGQRSRALFAGLVIAGAIAAIVILAMQADGRETLEATSHDGGAWLVDQPSGEVRHVEWRTKLATARIAIGDEARSDLVVRQSGDTIMVHNRGNGQIWFIGATSAQREGGRFVAENGATVWATPEGIAIHNGTQAWILKRIDLGRAESVEDFTNQDNEQDDEAEHNASAPDEKGITAIDAQQLVVTDGGAVVVVSSDGYVSVGDEERGQLPDDVRGSDVRLTTVGAVPVIEAGGRWFVAGTGGLRELDAEVQATLLSRPTAESATVAFVDTENHVQTINLRTGALTDMGLAGGTPTQIIWHGACAHLLLDGQRLSSLIRCDGIEDEVRDLVTSRAELRLVNQTVWIDGAGQNDYAVEQGKLVEIRRSDPEVEVATPEVTPSVTPNAEQGSVDEATSTLPCTDLEPGVPAAPVAVDDDAAGQSFGRGIEPPTRFGTRIGRPVVADVLRNDFDADCDVLLIDEILSVTGEAAVSVTPDRLAVYVEPSGNAQTIRFEYVISDGTRRSDTATAEIDVLPADSSDNRPPVPRLDRLIGAAGSVVRVDVIENDIDPDGDSLRLASIGEQSTPGEPSDDDSSQILASHPGGEVLVALPQLTGADDVIKVPYVIADEYSATARGEIEIIVRLAGSNFELDARNDSAVTRVGQRITLNVLDNDVDGDNDPLTVARGAAIISPAESTAFIATSADGELTFEADVEGTYLLSYGASDGTALDEAFVRIEVASAQANRPPVAVRDDAVLALGESQILRPLDNDGDPDGDVVGISFVGGNDNLDVQVVNGTTMLITLGPGASNIETFEYRISDGLSESNRTTVLVTRSDEPFIDGPPVAVDDAVRVRAGRTNLVRVLPNDFDPEGRQVKLADGDGTALEVQGAGDAPKVSAEVTAEQRFVGVAVPADLEARSFTFGYSIVDTENPDARSSALVRVAVVGPAEINTPPTARIDQAVVRVNGTVEIAVLDNDTDDESDPISLTGALPDPPRAGTVSFNDDGTLSYTARDVAGTDRFTYAIRDSQGDTSVGVVEVGVLRPSQDNNPPVAADDPDFEFVAGTGVQYLDVLANDTDFDDDALEIIEVTGADLEVSADGTGLEIAVPELLSESAIIGVRYRIADGRGGTDVAQATIEVLANSDPLPPIAEPDAAGPLRVGETANVDVLANDRDPDARVAYSADGTRIDLKIISTGPGGRVVTEQQTHPDDPDRTITVQLIEVTAPEATGEIEYTIEDKAKDEDEQPHQVSSFITVTVEPNLPPEVQSPINLPADGTAWPNDELLVINLGDYATDPDGDELTFILPGSGASTVGGTATAGQDPAIVTFDPDDDAVEATIQFSVRDGQGNEIAGVINVTLEGFVNRPPVGIDSTIDMEAGIDQPLDLNAFFSDEDNDALTYQIVTAPEAPITIAGDPGGGRIELVVDQLADATTTTLVAEANDGEDTALATLTINVAPTSIDPPTAQPDELTTNQRQAVTINVTDNDIDVLGQGLTVVDAFAPIEGGSVSHSADSITYDPGPDFFGTTTIRYVIQDARNRDDGQAEGLVTANVIGFPSAPQQVVAEATGPTNVTVTWRTPADNGAPITSYDVIVIENGSVSTTVTTGSAEPQVVFDTLTPGATYEFEIVATNIAGNGEPSARSNAAIPDQVPDAPATPGVEFETVGSGELRVTWIEPDAPGTEIETYQVQGNCAGQSAINQETADTSLVVSGLTNAERCTFRVAAVNQAVRLGEPALFSPDSAPECPVAQPGQPQPPTVTRGNALAEVAWAPPENPDCEALAGYEIQRYLAGGAADGGPEEAAFGQSGLTSAPLVNGTEYQFTIRARNRRGWGETSALSAIVKPCTTPGPTPALTLTPEDLFAIVARTGEAPDNGCLIERYEVEVSGVGVSAFPADGRITGLVNGTEYSVRAQAFNEEGPGDWSPAATVTPRGRPFPGTITSTDDGQDADGVPLLGWRIEFTSADFNGDAVTSTAMTGSVQAFASGGATGTGQCVNAQGNQCLSAAPSTATTATESCKQSAQSVGVSATGTNEAGTSDPTSLDVDLEGCPDSSSSLTVTGVDTIGGTFSLGWSPPPSSTEVWLQLNGGPADTWDGPHNAGAATLPTPANNGDTLVTMWACNPYGCKASNSQTVSVPLVSDFREIPCWATRAEYDIGDNAYFLGTIHGFAPNEGVSLSWPQEHPGGATGSSSGADSNGVVSLLWECVVEGAFNPPRHITTVTATGSSGKTGRFDVVHLPPG